MQTRSRIRFIAAIAVIFFLASCGKSNQQGKMIPKDAGFVIHWNAKSINSKINFAELKQSDWYKQMIEKTSADSTQSDFIKKLKDNKNNGLDSLSDFIFFTDKSGSSTSLVLEAGLKDEKNFETFLQNVYPAGSIKQDEALKSMVIENKAVITWNNEKVAAVFQMPSMPNFGKMNNSNNLSTVDIPQLTAYGKSLFNLKEDNSLAKNEKFTDLINTEGDMHVWVNLEKLTGNIPQMGMLSMLKMDKLFEGNVSAYTLNFENGKITVKAKGYYGKEMNDIYKKYSGGTINNDMLKNIPSKDVVGIFAMHFKPEAVNEMLKLSGMDGFINLFLAKNGLSLDDIIKANKGDIMIAVSDLMMKKDSVKIDIDDEGGKGKFISMDKPDAKFIFSASINDKDAFNKILNFVKRETGNAASESISFNSNKDYFAVGNSADYVSKYLAGGSNTDLPFYKKISGSTMGIYVDLQKIITVLSSVNNKDSITKKLSDESLKVWDNITITGGDYSNGCMNHLLEINLVDKNTNSMMQLIKYAATMGELAKEKQKKLAAAMNDDENGINKDQNN